jgi:tryptophan halogenase
MTAVGLAKFLKALQVSIRLIESEQIGTVGVGEATIPPLMHFIRGAGIDENDLMRKVGGTFKLGIEFKDWTRPGHTYIHPFGQTGFDLGPLAFSTCWLHARRQGRAARLAEYSLEATAAYAGKFMRPVAAANSPLERITYALHFDASLFARQDTVEAAWSVVEPVLDDAVPIVEYAAETWGPEGADALIAPFGRWRAPVADA